MNIIEVNDLNFAYYEKPILRNVSFTIKQGQYTTIIGHNGSGKSTLARLLAGLIFPCKDSIKIFDTYINEESVSSVRKKIGIVFQNPDNQFIGSTVEDDIAFGLENYQVEPSKMQEIIENYIKEVDLIDYLKHQPNNLSGGQKQRVAIASVLAISPNIIIFDEATSMLDPKGKKEIKDLISKINKQTGITVVSITHDIEEALNSDYCIVLNNGEVVFQDKPSNIFENASKLASIQLDIPFSYKIRNEFKKHNIDISADKLSKQVEELWQLNSKK